MIFILILILTLQFSILPVSALPTAGDNFEYTIIRKVGSGNGEYSGYTDELKSNGKYEIISVDSNEVQFHASYSWTYSNSEGLTQEGSEYRIASMLPVALIAFTTFHELSIHKITYADYTFHPVHSNFAYG